MARDASEIDSDGVHADGLVNARFVFGDDGGGSLDGGDGSDGNGGSGGGNSSDSGNGSVGTKRPRGRPRGSTNRKPARTSSQASVAASIDGLTGAIHMLHFGLANGVLAMTKNAQLARVFLLSQDESRGLAVPLAAIQNRYVGEVNGDAQLLLNLGTALIGVYGGKFMAAMMAGKPDAASAATATA